MRIKLLRKELTGLQNTVAVGSGEDNQGDAAPVSPALEYLCGSCNAGALLRLLTLLVLLSFAANQMSAQAAQTPLTLLEALSSILKQHPLIAYQQAQIQIDQGLRLQAASAFDTVTSAGVTEQLTSLPLTRAEQEEYALINAGGAFEQTQTTVITGGVSRLFRSGIQIGAYVPFARNVDDVVNPEGVNTAEPILTLTVPLLRGRGHNVVDAPEMAAKIEVEAGGYDLSQEVAQLLTTGAADYWNVVAAQQQVAIGIEAETRARTDVENTQTLIDADQIPRENLNEVRASLAQATSNVAALQQTLTAAQVQLAADMGLAAKEIVSLSPRATETLPDPSDAPEVADTPVALRQYVAEALQNRADYLAAEKRVAEQDVLVGAARNQLLPALNITGSGAYNGLKEGRSTGDLFGAAGSSLDRPSVAVGLSYNFAPRNELARGQLLQAISISAQRKVQAQQAARFISTAVGTAVLGVQQSRMALHAATNAVAFYRASLAGQREKFHLGMASVIDLLTVETNLTTALSSEVQANLNYAQALTQLRFATGTILTPGSGVHQVDAQIFRSLPKLGVLSAPGIP